MAVCLQLPAANCQNRALRKIGSAFTFLSAAAARTDTFQATYRPAHHLHIHMILSLLHLRFSC